MGRTDDREATVSRVWKEHCAAEFPSGLRGAVLADDVDMVLLDASAAGCISTWLGNRGYLDNDRQRILYGLLCDFERVLPLLTDPYEAQYYERLHLLARLVHDGAPLHES